MIAGFSGHLVSESFLDARLDDAASGGTPALNARLAAWRRNCGSLGPASSVRAVIDVAADPLVRLLGFAGLEQLEQLKDAVGASLIGGTRPIVLLVAAWGQPLDPLWRLAVIHAKRRRAEWAVLFNATHLRLIDARRVYSRRHVELDLDIAADQERAAAAFWMLFSAAAFSAVDGPPPLASLIAASERHGAGVCRSLRDGVLAASADVLGALITGPNRMHVVQDFSPAPSGSPARSAAAGLKTCSTHEAFEQALTIVYRILFLLFAEARGLVPMWHRVYRDSYSVETLRESAAAALPVTGLWDTLRAISRLAHAGCRAGNLRVTPFNGRLFAPARTPLAERRNLDEEAGRRAILALATRRTSDGTAREPIAYRDLGVEQLGAVYETLLDYEPIIAPDLKVGPTAAASSCRRVVLRRGSGRRKATGTFYTPQPIAEYLVRRTLAPLVDSATPERILALKVVDPAMGSGAFLVAACLYLARAYESALVRAGGCLPSDFGPAEHASIRRLIAERCLYGVDLNPMAVQLARLSLWLTTLASDRPLTFLDHHLQSGDSLLGAWVAQLGRAPQVRRRQRTEDTLPLFETAALAATLRDALPVRFTLASVPDDTLEQVRTKERALAALVRRDAALSKWKRVADLWCARWFWPGGAPPASAFAALSDRILTNRSVLPEPAADRYLVESEAIADAHRFFHWELEFPEVFFDEHGRRLPSAGFDAVIGNPPWDMIRADSGSPTDRSEQRAEANAIVRFTRGAGVYAAQSDGHANRYQLFLERAIMLASRGGRLGLVLPSGLAADHGSARLRRRLFSECAVDAIVGFDNRLGVFPIHRSVRFVLLTATAGSPTIEIGCRLGEHDPSVLDNGDDEADEWFPIRVTTAALSRITGSDLALPDLPDQAALTIAERAASLFPPLGQAGDSRADWGAQFGRELNATDDRLSFRAPGQGLPIVEGRQISPFRTALEASRWSVSERDADRLLGDRHRHIRLGYRDVASATNRLTLIAALLPRGCVSTHTVFCLRPQLPLATQYFLCGLFNSFVLNYLVRLRVTTHVTTAIVERLPVPRCDRTPAGREIAALARICGRGAEGAASALAKLNARVAELYQLDVEEFAHVVGTFPLVPQEDRDRAMREFQKRRV
jgi:Eco57I restriction-modification methylase